MSLRCQWMHALLAAALLTTGCSAADTSSSTQVRPDSGTGVDASGPPCACGGTNTGGSAQEAGGPDPGDSATGDESTASGDDVSVQGDSRSPGENDGGQTCSSTAGTSSDFGWLGDWGPGDYPPGDIMAQNYLTISGVKGQMGNDRHYKVHVPPSYSPTTPMAVLFCLHGLGQNAVMFCLDSGVAWSTKSDAEGFILVMPNGYQSSWNGGTCCGGAATADLDDVSLMRTIFAEVAAHLNVDPHRVYATGLSNGGYLSYRLACEASDLFVAIAPTAGAVGIAAIKGAVDGGLAVLSTSSDLVSCTPKHPVSVLDIHGTSDPIIAYDVQAPSLATFYSADGCSTTTAPAVVPISGGDATCVTYRGCPMCPHVDVTGCSIQGGGHCWFGSSDCGTGAGSLGNAFVGNNSTFMKNTDAIWAFLSRVSR
jgi:polyhydroxybutyrate depolymerase